MLPSFGLANPHCNTVLFLVAVLVSLTACKSRQDITAGEQTNATIQRYSFIFEPLMNPEKLDDLAGRSSYPT